MQLCRLTSPKIFKVSQQAGPRRNDGLVQVQRPWPRRANGIVLVWRPMVSRPQDPGKANVSVWVQRQEKTQCPSLKAVRQEEFPLKSPFCSIQAFNWLRRSTHLRESNLLYSVYWIKFWSHPETLTDTPRIMFDQMSEHLMAHSTWHIKLTTTISP